MSKQTKTNEQTSSNEVYAKVIAQVLAGLENGEAAWRRTWNYQAVNEAPRNPLNDVQYSGFNAFILYWNILANKWSTPFFATFNQVTESGGTVIKGSKGIPLVRYFEVRESLKEAQDREPSASNADRRVEFMRPTVFYVFHLETQTTGLEDKLPAINIVFDEFTPIEKCESVLEAYSNKPEMRIGAGGRAYYMPILDFISMPPKEAFESPEAWYSTLYHEHVHGTGDKSRLGRDLTGKRGSVAYATEELIAEMAAGMICGVLGIDLPELTENMVEYCKGWADVIRRNPEVVIRAAGKAQAAADYILNGGTSSKAEVEGEAVNA